jgi:hypothetical protein
MVIQFKSRKLKLKLDQTRSMCIKIYQRKSSKLKMRSIEKSRDLIMIKKTPFQKQKIAFNLRTPTKSRFIYLGFRKKSDALRVSINYLLKTVALAKKLIQSLHQP